MKKKKEHTQGITDRFLQLMEEVIGDGLVKNQRAFAISIGEYQQNISMMEAGKRTPTLNDVATACEKYGYSPSWVILNIGDKKINKNEVKPIESRINDLEVEVIKLKRVLKNMKV